MHLIPHPSLPNSCRFPNCTTVTFQPAYGVAGGAPLVMQNGSDTLGFCQSSQPKWSAFRDPRCDQQLGGMVGCMGGKCGQMVVGGLGALV